MQSTPATSGTLLIRADANLAIGTGHVMRCLALAQAWQDAGGQVTFASTALPPKLAERLVGTERCSLKTIEARPGSDDDLAQTLQLAESIRPASLVLDGYYFGPDFQLALRDARWRLLFLDDDRRHETYHADLILNQNAGASAGLYDRRTHNARLLVGCHYAMLRREFLQASRKNATSETVSRILLTLGGADSQNLTKQFLVVLCLCIPANAQIHVVIGPANPHVAELQEIASTKERIALHVAPENLPQIMADCDLAVTAAGSSVYELAYLGVPMLLVVAAENQRSIATALDNLGAAVRVDEFPSSRTADLPSAFERLVSDKRLRAECAAKGRQLVDGQGAARVVAALYEAGGAR